VDEIAAEHVKTDLIIHFGQACLSRYVILFHFLYGGYRAVFGIPAKDQ
jgi:diphthamide biosynthesis enzyme Dph1/Dph2-like protein